MLHSIFTTPRAVCVMPKNHRLAWKTVITPISQMRHSWHYRRKTRFVSPWTRSSLRMAATHSARDSLRPDDRNSCGERHGHRAGKSFRHRGPHDRRNRRGPFEPAVHFRALILRPPDGINSTLIADFTAELYAARNALSGED